jgi:N4-gp56 family major capsid protein
MSINTIAGTAGTAGTIQPALQAYYDRNLLDRAIPADVHGRFGQVRPLKTRSGNQIKFRRYEALNAATSPLVEGVTPSGSQITTTDVTATLAQYGDYVNVTDMVDLTNQDAVLTEVGMVLGEQAGFSVDQVRRDVMVAGTNVIYTNGSARNTLNTVISSVALRTAIRYLGRQNAKFVRQMIKADTNVGTVGIRAAYIGLVHPDTEAQLESIPGYIPVSEYSDAMKAEEDEVGSFRNIRFFKSTNCKVFLAAGLAVGTDGMISAGATSNDVYATLIIAANAYGVCPLSGNAMTNIIKPIGSAGAADPLNQRATSGWKAITTTKILNDNWITRIEHCNLTTLT